MMENPLEVLDLLLFIFVNLFIMDTNSDAVWFHLSVQKPQKVSNWYQNLQMFIPVLIGAH